jgi:hypothetical protein
MQKVPVAYVVVLPHKKSFGVRIPPGYDSLKPENTLAIDACREAAMFYFSDSLLEAETASANS